MPANDSNSVVLASTHAALSSAEQRVFDRAERTIARGLKSFVEVGMALKEIRDRRLYRQLYSTFEEYCARRWDFSRPRAYELCAASEVIADLSANADIKLLPENEAQARPLTRLKDPAARRRAWHTAVTLAAAQERPVTARDTEEAVRRLNGNGRVVSAGDGEPVFSCILGDNADLIAAVARLYLPKGCRVADITYGRGVFWQKVNLADYRLSKSDKITCPSSPHDFRQLPYQAGFFDVVVFDPPYAHAGDSMKVEPCYQTASTASGLSHQDIMAGYERGMTEAARVLKPGGTLWVKCADEIEHGVQQRSHMEVFQFAQRLGLIDQDLFLLMQEGRPVTNTTKQKHARKNCSFLWVFRKPARPK
jgi:hypothetical protein